MASSECVRTGGCYQFCNGFWGDLTVVCRGGRCRHVRASACPGDCDADAKVDIAELTVGIDVALGHHPLAACANLDTDSDGAVAVGELVRAVSGALDGCTAILARRPGLRGYYDAQLPASGVSAPALATVYDTDGWLSLRIDQGPDQGFVLSGPLVDGRLTLSGSFAVSDIAYWITGEATVATDAAGETITGTLQSTYPVAPIPESFVLHRSARDDPSRFAGSYTLRFSESPGGSGAPSHASIRIEIARDGRAMSGEGEDRDARGVLLGTLTTGDCAVAPQGALSCTLAYLFAATPLSNPLRLTGVLATGGTAAGEFVAGAFPPFDSEPYVAGTWNATRSP